MEFNFILNNTFDIVDWNHDELPVKFEPFQFKSQVLITFHKKTKQQVVYVNENFLIVLRKNGLYKWIDYENALIEQKFNHCQEMYTVQLLKGSTFIILQGEIASWYDFMKKYTIQNHFSKTYFLNHKVTQIGNYSEVFIGIQKQTDQTYYVKVFNKSQMTGTNDKQALINQLKIIRKVSLTKEINLIETFESKNHIYVILDLYSGGNLGVYLGRNAPLNEQKVAILIHQLLLSVQNLDKCGVISRDIKPENILLKTRDEIDKLQIGDYEVAEFISQSGKYKNQKVGTPGYMAPEIIQGKAYFQKVDVYSIGIIMFIALTGHQPFEGTRTQILQNSLNHIIDFSHVYSSSQALLLLKQLLHSDQQQRISVDQALQNEWLISQVNKIQPIKNKPYFRIKKQYIMSPIQQHFSTQTFLPKTPNIEDQRRMDSIRNSVQILINPKKPNFQIPEQKLKTEIDTQRRVKKTMNRLLLNI